MRISTTRKMIRIILAYKDHKKMTGSNNNNNNNKIGKSFWPNISQRIKKIKWRYCIYSCDQHVIKSATLKC